MLLKWSIRQRMPKTLVSIFCFAYSIGIYTGQNYGTGRLRFFTSHICGSSMLLFLLPIPDSVSMETSSSQHRWLVMTSLWVCKIDVNISMLLLRLSAPNEWVASLQFCISASSFFVVMSSDKSFNTFLQEKMDFFYKCNIQAQCFWEKTCNK